MKTHGEWNDPANIGPKLVDFSKMPPRNPAKLYEGMLRRIIRMVDAADADADADAWAVLEDIKIASEDILLHGLDGDSARRSTQRGGTHRDAASPIDAAMREP